MFLEVKKNIGRQIKKNYYKVFIIILGESFMSVDETKPIVRTNPVFEKMPPKNSSARNNDKKDQQKKMNVKNLNEEVSKFL